MLIKHPGLAAILLILFGAASRDAAADQIVNGGFETGDLAGWDANDPGLVSAVFSADKLAEPGTYFPVEGDYFATLTTGIDVDSPTLLSQSFTAVGPQDISFQVYFDAGDNANNDFGFARLLDGAGGLVAELFRSDVAVVGSFGSTDWTAITYRIAVGGSYTLQFGVTNVGDNDSFFDSSLGVDAVSLRAVPEPASLTALATGLAGLLALGLRRRLAK